MAAIPKCEWQDCGRRAVVWVPFPGEIPGSGGDRCPSIRDSLAVCAKCATAARDEVARLINEHDCAWNGICTYCSCGHCGMMPDGRIDEEHEEPIPRMAARPRVRRSSRGKSGKPANGHGGRKRATMANK